ncbi:MAG: 50S ribosomal protein L17 [Chloroflexi bacterium]|nr:50S ribosomal protein L17 [Chloroflexota bacterium]
MERLQLRHKVTGRQFGRPSGQRKALFRNLVTDLLRNGHIKTTIDKAKEIRPIAEKMVTYGKKGTLNDRRLAASFITDPKVVKKVFDEIGPKFKDRPGGYTRISRLGNRAGDAAEMAIIELISE